MPFGGLTPSDVLYAVLRPEADAPIRPSDREEPVGAHVAHEAMVAPPPRPPAVTPPPFL